MNTETHTLCVHHAKADRRTGTGIREREVLGERPTSGFKYVPRQQNPI
jgi:hypothetical protein